MSENELMHDAISGVTNVRLHIVCCVKSQVEFVPISIASTTKALSLKPHTYLSQKGSQPTSKRRMAVSFQSVVRAMSLSKHYQKFGLLEEAKPFLQCEWHMSLCDGDCDAGARQFSRHL